MARRNSTRHGSSATQPNSKASADAPARWQHPAVQLAMVGIVATLARGIYFFQLWGTLPFSTLVIDGRAYDAWAQRIAAGEWWGTEVFYQSPLYPYAMAIVYSVAGHQPLAVRLVQAVLGVGACLLLALAGRLFFGQRAGFWAGLSIAIYPPALFFDSIVQKASLDLFLMAILLWVVARIRSHARWSTILVLGLALGALSLNRENARILYPLLAMWLVVGLGLATPRVKVWRVALFSVGMALVLMPVALRNYWVGGEFLLTTSQLGPNFYIGNHAGATGRYEPLVPFRGDPKFERSDATRLAEQALGRTLSPAEVSGYWMDQSWSYIRQQPVDWLRLLGRKVFYTLNGTELIDSEGIEAYADFSWLLAGLCHLWHFGLLLPLAVLGAWATRGAWRSLWVLYGIFLSLAAATAIFYVFARYRYTLVPVAVLFAGAGLDALPRLVRDWRQGHFWGAWGWGCVLVLATAVFVNLPLPDFREKAYTYMNLGSGLLQDGRYEEALVPLRRALAIRQDMPTTHHNLGRVLMALGRKDEAADEFTQALKFAPDFGEAHASLGQCRADQGRLDEAIFHLRRAVELVGEPTQLRVELATLLLKQADTPAAVVELRAALRATPDSVLAANNLAWVLATHADARYRDGREAVAIAERMIASVTSPDRSAPAPPAEVAALLDTLAAAYAEAGQFDQAVATTERALGLLSEQPSPQLAASLQERLKLFAQREPVRTEFASSPDANAQQGK